MRLPVARRRKKIQYCYEDYMKTLPAEERTSYQEKFAPLVQIIEDAENDKAIMAQAREFDAANGTAMFEEAVHLTVYCIACSKFNCDC